MLEKTKLMPFKGEELRPFFFRPFGLIDEFVNEVESLWRHPLRRFEETPAWMPKVDVFKKEGELIVKADLPGMKKEEVRITFEDGALVLSGERKEEKELQKESFYRAECLYGSFYRRLPLGFKIDPAKIMATFTDGVLEVHVPMPVLEQPKAQEIPIN